MQYFNLMHDASLWKQVFLIALCTTDNNNSNNKEIDKKKGIPLIQLVHGRYVLFLITLYVDTVLCIHIMKQNARNYSYLLEDN